MAKQTQNVIQRKLTGYAYDNQQNQGVYFFDKCSMEYFHHENGLTIAVHIEENSSTTHSHESFIYEGVNHGLYSCNCHEGDHDPIQRIFATVRALCSNEKDFIIECIAEVEKQQKRQIELIVEANEEQVELIAEANEQAGGCCLIS